jgi:hypothetical protein
MLDTSVVIALDHLDEKAELPDEPCISAVTLAELSTGPFAAAGLDDQAGRVARLQWTESRFPDPVLFDAAEARAFGRPSASLRARGRKAMARSFDAIIAATAMSHGLAVFTANPADFEGIEGLEVVPVSREV